MIDYFLQKNNLKKVKNLNKRIYVSPGHGGSDTGAVGNGLIERDINLVMALSIGNLLKKLGAEIKYARTNNETYKSIEDRTDEAKDWGADLIVDVHNNAGGGDGFEVIHTIFEDQSIGDDVARVVVYAIEKFTNQNFRRYISKANSQGRDWFGMNRLAGSIPSITTEGAFLDTKDHEIIDTVEEQQEFGYVIAAGVALYFGALEEVEDTPYNCINQAIDKIIEGLREIRECRNN